MQNNGIDGYYNKYNFDGNCIISCGEVSGMYSTFHSGKIWALDTTRILKPKFALTENIALFLIPLLNANMVKFSYGLKAKPNDIENLKILLPFKNNKIDFEYMETFIRERERDVMKELYDHYSE